MEMAPTSGPLLEVPGGRLFVERQGRGPPLVLIHAAIADRRMWDREFERYSSNRTVFRYDVRGFGRSTSATAPYSDTDDLLRLFRAHRIEHADLLGSSNGGRIAIDFALLHPELVDRLVLAASGLGGFEPSEDPEEHQAFHRMAERMGEIFAAIKAGDRELALEKIRQLWCSAQTGRSLELVRQIMRENAEEILTDRSQNQSTPLEPPAAERLGSLRAPTLILEGDRDAEGMRYISDRLEREIAGARRAVVAGGDHLMNLARPDEFDREVLSHLGEPSSLRRR